MVVIGTILEAVLVSQIDFTCLGSPQASDEPGIFPIWMWCSRDTSKVTLSLSEVSGTLCRTPGVCLSSKNNSDKDGAEIVETVETKNKGGLWKLTKFQLVNGFGLCVSKDLKKEQLIQKKCDRLTKTCLIGYAFEIVNGIRSIYLECQTNSYFNSFSFNEDLGTICRKPGICLVSQKNSDQDRAPIVQSVVTTDKGGIWKYKDGNFVNGFGLCLERDLNDSPSQLIQAKCNPESFWQKINLSV